MTENKQIKNFPSKEMQYPRTDNLYKSEITTILGRWENTSNYMKITLINHMTLRRNYKRLKFYLTKRHFICRNLIASSRIVKNSSYEPDSTRL